VREGNLSTLKVLLEQGADPDFVDSEGLTPIYFAIKHGRFELFEALLKTEAIDLFREDLKG
jgi:ankyrin repeat protein